MAEVTRKRTGQLLRELFSVLIAQPSGMPAYSALEHVRAVTKLTPYEEGNFDSGGQRFEKIIRWATVDCVKAGWLIKQKGIWFITDEGRNAYHELQDPEAFYKKAAQLYRAWKSDQTSEPPVVEVPDAGSPDADAAVTFEKADEEAWKEIQNYIFSLSPYDFQNLAAALVRSMGYYVSWIAPPGKDGGVDIVAWSDPLGTRPPRIKVQVKRQQQAIPVGELRSFMAMLGDDDVGLFVSASTFTKDAADEARTQESRRITLIDLERFIDLWIANYQALDDASRRLLALKPIYFLAPSP